MVTTDKKDDLLRKISGLLAKAESSEHEGERQVFMAKADELMMKYNIELYELAASQDRTDQRTPIIHDFDYKFAFESGPFPEISDDLWSLFCAVARHTNCLIVFHRQHFSGVAKSSRQYTVPIIGTDLDLGYMTLLFTSLMTQLVETLHPSVDKNKSYEENLRTFREAGWGWLEVAAKMQEAGYDLGMSVSDARHKEAHAYRRWCKATGVEQNYAHFKTFRRNFASGFVSRVAVRLNEMRQETVTSLGTGLELALRDQSLINQDFMTAEFGSPGMSRGGSLARSSRKFDSAAYTGGRAAGSNARIVANPGKGVSGGGKHLGK